jgi:hypothetical protein
MTRPGFEPGPPRCEAGHSFFYLVCEANGTAATPGLLCQPQVIVKMIVEKQMECRLAGETEVFGENLPQRQRPGTNVSSSRLLLSVYAGSSLTDFLTLKVEAIRSSETSVHIRSTRRYIPEDGILSHRCENLKSHIEAICLY